MTSLLVLSALTLITNIIALTLLAFIIKWFSTEFQNLNIELSKFFKDSDKTSKKSTFADFNTPSNIDNVCFAHTRKSTYQYHRQGDKYYLNRDFIIEYMKKSKMTRGELAIHIGFNVDVLNKMLSNRHALSNRSMDKIRVYFDTTPDQELFTTTSKYQKRDKNA